MDQDETATTHAHLKQLLLQQIKSQEKTQEILKEIFRRISLIYIILSAVIIIGIMFLIYVNNQPGSKANVALKEVESLNTRISLQRQYIEIDRKDLETVRKEFQELRDSVKRIKNER